MTRAVAPIVLLLLFTCGTAFGASEWKEFKKRYVSEDGRVIDRIQQQASHSEGQGYGMLLSVAFNDRETFERCWSWTRENLQKRADALLTWKWGERPSGDWAIVDYNNATDGDLLVAGALLWAARRFEQPSYQEMARPIIRDIRTRLTYTGEGRDLLLPGYFGFFREDGLVLNPSYQVFPVFRLFAEIDDPPFWRRIEENALRLVEESRFGQLRLPADWVVLDGNTFRLDDRRPPRFGYEAIRVVLYLAWIGRVQQLDGVARLLELSHRLGYVPRFVDLSADSLSLETSSAGFLAVFARYLREKGEPARAEELQRQADDRLLGEKDDYYSWVLYLLARIEVGA